MLIDALITSSLWFYAQERRGRDDIGMAISPGQQAGNDAFAAWAVRQHRVRPRLGRPHPDGRHLLFVVLQRHVMSGLATGSVKG
jgi:hypothetical protein